MASYLLKRFKMRRRIQGGIVTTAFRRARRLIPLAALVGAGALALTACSGPAGRAAAGARRLHLSRPDREHHDHRHARDPRRRPVCAEANDGAPLTPDSIAGTQWDQQLQLLAARTHCPTQLAAGTPSLMKHFIDAGQVLDLPRARRARRRRQDPARRRVHHRGAVRRRGPLRPADRVQHRGHLVQQAALRRQRHRGARDLGRTRRRRRDAQDAPASSPSPPTGKDGWPITRLVGNYIFRDLGPDALQKVADGDAKLTDPEYVEAADAVADLGKAGYFGDGVGSIDYNTAVNQFLTGKAAMFYMGSWALGELQRRDAEQDRRRQHRLHAVPRGRGRRRAASTRSPPTSACPVDVRRARASTTTPTAWLECIAENYGDTVLDGPGRRLRLRAQRRRRRPARRLTQIVQDDDRRRAVERPVVRGAVQLEGHDASARPTAARWSPAAISGADFMELVQAANDEG